MPAHAIVFDFSWSTTTNGASVGNFSDQLTSLDTSATVMGTIEINAAPGAMFTASDVTDYSLTLVGDPDASATFTDETQSAFIISGMISAVGDTATLTDFFVSNTLAASFGCQEPGCALSTGDLDDFFIQAEDALGNGVDVDYADQAAALASFNLTASDNQPGPAVVPLPASLPLALAGFAALAGLARRRA